MARVPRFTVTPITFGVVWGGGFFHPLLLGYWLVQFEGTPGLGLAARCLPFCWLLSGALQDQVTPTRFEPMTPPHLKPAWVVSEWLSLQSLRPTA